MDANVSLDALLYHHRHPKVRFGGSKAASFESYIDFPPRAALVLLVFFFFC